MTQDNPEDDIQRFLLDVIDVIGKNPAETGESPQYDAPIYERDDAPETFGDDDDDAHDEISQLVPVEP